MPSQVDEPENTSYEGRDEDYELAVVVDTHAIPHPRTMMIKSRNTLVAHPTVLGPERFPSHAVDAKRLAVQPALGCKFLNDSFHFSRTSRSWARPGIKSDRTEKVVCA